MRGECVASVVCYEALMVRCVLDVVVYLKCGGGSLAGLH